MKRVGIALAALAASTAGFLPAAVASDGAQLNPVVATARQATVKYHDVAAALADGYVKVGGCVELPGAGGMGFHYVNPRLAADPAIAADQPEQLLYAPGPDGSLKLAGVEYFKADADQNLATSDDRPSLAGVPFEGPMAGHGPGMPIHYDLHVWAWRANPEGMFADWNPNVDC